MPPDGPVRLVVFDVDGTLYSQSLLRAVMAGEIARSWMRDTSIAADTAIVRQYRRTMELVAETDQDLASVQRRTAISTGCSEARVRTVVEEWLQRRPLRRLPLAHLPLADDTVLRLREAGVATAAWSDYPAEPKLRILGIDMDYVVSAWDADVKRLKPHPAGLLKALALAGASASQTLMVGDRRSRDGAAAARLGVRFIWAPNGIRKRTRAEVLAACGIRHGAEKDSP